MPSRLWKTLQEDGPWAAILLVAYVTIGALVQDRIVSAANEVLGPWPELAFWALWLIVFGFAAYGVRAAIRDSGLTLPSLRLPSFRTSKREPTSIVEFAKLLEAKLGWDFKGKVLQHHPAKFIDNPDVGFFEKALREAASLGWVALLGRQDCSLLFDGLKQTAVLQSIEGRHFADHWLHLVDLVDGPNTKIRTYTPGDPDPEACFWDLHVGDAAKALAWFRANGLRYRSRKAGDEAKLEEQSPDFSSLDNRDRFQLWEAACLWVDQRPKMPLSSAAHDQFKKFEVAIRNNVLSVSPQNKMELIYNKYDEIRGKETKANPNWTATREALRTYAILVSEKPQFLFPKERVLP